MLFAGKLEEKIVGLCIWDVVVSGMHEVMCMARGEYCCSLSGEEDQQ